MVKMWGVDRKNSENAKVANVFDLSLSLIFQRGGCIIKL
jgi:hypothetical protein